MPMQSRATAACNPERRGCNDISQNRLDRLRLGDLQCLAEAGEHRTCGVIGTAQPHSVRRIAAEVSVTCHQ
jgi:hypothetical protein